MTSPLLAGVRVVTIEQAVAAPLCTKHLADLGASVIKVEPPGGDFARQYDGAVHGTSAHFTWLNGGKRSIALELRRPVGRRVFNALAATSDVLVCNIASSARERLIPDAALVDLNRRLIRCYISGYSVDGPYADRKSYDALIQGEAGVIAATGTPESLAKCGVSIADVGAGVYAFALVNAALIAANGMHEGTRIDVSLFDVVTDWLSPLLLAERAGVATPPPAGSRHATIVPYGTYRCRDGKLINLAVQNDGQWKRLCALALEKPELVDDSAWSTNALRADGRATLEPILEKAIARFDEADLISRLDRADVPWGRVNSIAEVVNHPELVERDRWQDVSLGNGAHGSVMKAPFYLDGRSPSPADVPALGEDTMEIMRELGFSSGDVDELEKERHV